MLTLIWIFSLLQFMTACRQQPEPETYLIPTGFKGKVNIIFNQFNGAAVKYESGRRVYEIPNNGILLTQFEDEDGLINHQYYYIDSTGNRQTLKIDLEDNISNPSEVGIFRDGTLGVYGNSDNPKSLSYQEFYVTDTKDFESYFTQGYQQKFQEKIKELISARSLQ